MCLPIEGRWEAAEPEPLAALDFFFFFFRLTSSEAESEEEELLTMSFSRKPKSTIEFRSAAPSPSVRVCEGWTVWPRQQSDRQPRFLFPGREDRVAVIVVRNRVSVSLDSLCSSPQSCVLYSPLTPSRQSTDICWKFPFVICFFFFVFFFDAGHLECVWNCQANAEICSNPRPWVHLMRRNPS